MQISKYLYMNIHILDIQCFGFSVPRKDSWYMLLHKVNSNGWKSIDFNSFQDNLAKNVDSSYKNLVKISFEDLDTDQKYMAAFNNNLKKWILEIPDSPKDAVLPEDKKAFFTTQEFKNTCKRADEIISNALKSYDNMLKAKVENGDFLEVDETKLEAVIHMISDQILRRSLKLGKYEK